MTLPISNCACAVPDAVLFERIAAGLEAQGYCVLPNGLPVAVADELMGWLGPLGLSHFRPAAVGRGSDQANNVFVRRDKIFWIDDTATRDSAWLAWTQQLKIYLNRRLFLGLFSFESHFACYQRGDFYKRHRDAFRGQSNRMLSLVAYLNPGWEPDQGGELVLYSPDSGGELVKVVPAFGSLVLFLSEEFPHEVLPAQRERYSVAGWFRLNSSISDRVDPPR